MSEPQLLVDMTCETGEGPVWDGETATLTWLDIPAGALFSYDPASGVNTTVYRHTTAVGGHTRQPDGTFILFCADGAILHLVDGVVTPIHERIPAVVGSRFNDVSADPAGRVFCGTMPLGDDGPAHLYRLDTDGSLHLIWDDLELSNGIGFSPDHMTMYLSDSNRRRVFAADYDATSGDVTHRREIIAISPDAVPDGMTVDADGNLWVALWDGHGLRQYDPAGKELRFVEFPVRKVSSLSFGGEGFRTAYVTTAGGPERGEKEGALAGSLFSIELGVSGLPEFMSRIDR